MTKKQKRVLIRIIVSAVLVVTFSLVSVQNPYVRMALFLIPYLIIGYDILRKAVLGIVNGQVFDEISDGNCHNWRHCFRRVS